MGFQNSRIKVSILGLFQETLLDLFNTLLPLDMQLPAYHQRREVERDFSYVERRTNAEGLSFLTVQLPLLGKWVDNKLSGKPAEFPKGFSPTFLRIPLAAIEYLSQDGVEIDHEHAAFVRQLRTILYLVYKLELPSTPEQNDRKIAEFIEIEKELNEFVLPADNRWVEYGRHVLDAVVGGFDPSSGNFPKHGPGSVATGEKGDGKWVFTHLYDSLHQKYPYYDFMYGLRSNGRALHLASYTERYKNMIRLPYPTAKLCLVPKDSRGPRIISCEPLELQFMQQAVAHRLMHHLESLRGSNLMDPDSLRRSIHINFADQNQNAYLALSSSRSGEFATIDLSEASDRVSKTLFAALWPIDQQEHFNALRSHATTLPNGDVQPLEKFAPMGSAVCFPVESTIFYGLCVAALLAEGVPFARACCDVYVYGDDIIIPSKYYSVVRDVLELHGLKVNETKSFYSGYFRESCGIDAWHGHVVTPVRIRKLPGENPYSGSEHFAWCAYSAHFYEVNMPRAGDYCKELVELSVGRFIPFTTEDNGYLSVIRPGHETPLSEYVGVQWSVELSMPTAKVYTLKTRSSASGLNSYDRLLKNLLTADPETDPSRVVDAKSTQMSLTRRGLRAFSLMDWLASTD
jgi:hypothetical protein